MHLPTLSLALICSFACLAFPGLTGARPQTVLYLYPADSQTQIEASDIYRRSSINRAGRSPSSIRYDQLPDEFTCPMHPEVKSKTPGKCPKCGMELVPISMNSAMDCQLKLTSTPARVMPKERVRLDFAIFNSRTGEQVKQFGL